MKAAANKLFYKNEVGMEEINMLKADVDKKTLITWLGIIGIPLLVALIPTGETFTLAVKTFFVVTLFGIMCMVTGPFDSAIGCLFMMAGYCLLGLAPFATVFSSFANTVPWTVYGCLLLLNIVQNKTKLIERIACKCMIITGGTYRGIIFGMIILGIVINLLIPGVFTGLAIAAIAYGICKALDLGVSKASSGIMLAAVIGFIDAWRFIYCPPDMGVLIGIASTVTPLDMDYLTYFTYNAPWVVFPFIMAFIITKICRPEKTIDGKAYFIQRQSELGTLTSNEKKTLVVLVLFMVYLFTYRWHGLEMVYGFVLAPLLLYLPIFNVATREDLMTVNFPMVVFVAGCLSIGSVATYIGIPQLISDIVVPLLESRTNAFYLGFVYWFTVMFNLVMTPMAMMTAFSVPLTQIALDMGMSTAFPTLFTMNAGAYNLFLPYEAVLVAGMYQGFGNTKLSLFVKVFIIKMILTFLWIMFIMVPYYEFVHII